VEHAVQEVVPPRADRAVDMAALAALMAMGADQGRSAIEADLFLAPALAGLGFDRACGQSAGHRLADAFDARHPAPSSFGMAQAAGGVEAIRAGSRRVLSPRHDAHRPPRRIVQSRP
jgi:hypothetical protein